MFCSYCESPLLYGPCIFLNDHSVCVSLVIKLEMNKSSMLSGDVIKCQLCEFMFYLAVDFIPWLHCVNLVLYLLFQPEVISNLIIERHCFKLC